MATKTKKPTLTITNGDAAVSLASEHEPLFTKNPTLFMTSHNYTTRATDICIFEGDPDVVFEHSDGKLCVFWKQFPEYISFEFFQPYVTLKNEHIGNLTVSDIISIEKIIRGNGLNSRSYNKLKDIIPNFPQRDHFDEIRAMFHAKYAFYLPPLSYSRGYYYKNSEFILVGDDETCSTLPIVTRHAELRIYKDGKITIIYKLTTNDGQVLYAAAPFGLNRTPRTPSCFGISNTSDDENYNIVWLNYLSCINDYNHRFIDPDSLSDQPGWQRHVKSLDFGMHQLEQSELKVIKTEQDAYDLAKSAPASSIKQLWGGSLDFVSLLNSVVGYRNPDNTKWLFSTNAALRDLGAEVSYRGELVSKTEDLAKFNISQIISTFMPAYGAVNTDVAKTFFDTLIEHFADIDDSDSSLIYAVNDLFTLTPKDQEYLSSKSGACTLRFLNANKYYFATNNKKVTINCFKDLLTFSCCEKGKKAIETVEQQFKFIRDSFPEISFDEDQPHKWHWGRRNGKIVLWYWNPRDRKNVVFEYDIKAKTKHLFIAKSNGSVSSIIPSLQAIQKNFDFRAGCRYSSPTYIGDIRSLQDKDRDLFITPIEILDGLSVTELFASTNIEWILTNAPDLPLPNIDHIFEFSNTQSSITIITNSNNQREYLFGDTKDRENDNRAIMPASQLFTDEYICGFAIPILITTGIPAAEQLLKSKMWNLYFIFLIDIMITNSHSTRKFFLDLDSIKNPEKSAYCISRHRGEQYYAYPYRAHLCYHGKMPNLKSMFGTSLNILKAINDVALFKLERRDTHNSYSYQYDRICFIPNLNAMQGLLNIDDVSGIDIKTFKYVLGLQICRCLEPGNYNKNNESILDCISSSSSSLLICQCLRESPIQKQVQILAFLRSTFRIDEFNDYIRMRNRLNDLCSTIETIEDETIRLQLSHVNADRYPQFPTEYYNVVPFIPGMVNRIQNRSNMHLYTQYEFITQFATLYAEVMLAKELDQFIIDQSVCRYGKSPFRESVSNIKFKFSFSDTDTLITNNELSDRQDLQDILINMCDKIAQQCPEAAGDIHKIDIVSHTLQANQYLLDLGIFVSGVSFLIEGPYTISYLHDELSMISTDLNDVSKKPLFKAATMRVVPIEYSNEEYGLKIVAPQEPGDLVYEGSVLSHCVGTYVDPVINGTENIMLLRRIDMPNDPFFTVDILGDGQIRQVHCYHNGSPTEEGQVQAYNSCHLPVYNRTFDVLGFLREWAKWTKRENKPIVLRPETIMRSYGALCANRQ